MFLHILTTEWTSTRRKCRRLPAIPAWLDVYMHVFSLKSIKACSEGAKLTYFRHVNHNHGCCLIQLVQWAAGQDGEAADGLVRLQAWWRSNKILTCCPASRLHYHPAPAALALREGGRALFVFHRQVVFFYEVRPAAFCPLLLSLHFWSHVVWPLCVSVCSAHRLLSWQSCDIIRLCVYVSPQCCMNTKPDQHRSLLLRSGCASVKSLTFSTRSTSNQRNVGGGCVFDI